MKRSKRWLVKARQLCDELDRDDGIDPRILARKHISKSRDHKSAQLSKEAKRTLSLALAGELSDARLQDLEVIDVTTGLDDQFLVVTVTPTNSASNLDSNQLLKRLKKIQGYLRSTIAQSVKRKRVPALKFEVLHAPIEGNRNAY
jgi:ribosome-binding factor A